VIAGSDDGVVREGSEPAAATAVLSVWIEGDRPGILKIRLTSVSQLGSPDRAIGVTTSIPEAVALVTEWLEAFAARHDPGRAS